MAMHLTLQGGDCALITMQAIAPLVGGVSLTTDVPFVINLVTELIIVEEETK